MNIHRQVCTYVCTFILLFYIHSYICKYPCIYTVFCQYLYISLCTGRIVTSFIEVGNATNLTGAGMVTTVGSNFIQSVLQLTSNQSSAGFSQTIGDERISSNSEMTTTPVTALVPYEVISQAVLQTNSSDVRFVFTFFDDAVLFPTENTSDTSAPSTIVASSVLSVSVIGATISNLNTPIRLNFTKSQVCACIHTYCIQNSFRQTWWSHKKLLFSSSRMLLSK